MAKFEGEAATALELIAENGALVTFTRVGATPGVRDPVTQQTTGAKDLVFSMQAVGFGPGKSAEFRIGSLIGRNLEELHLAPVLGTCPEPGDLAKWKGKDWKVIWSDPLDPAGDGAPYCKAYLER